MLTKADERSEQVTTAHRAKLAYVYVRQSSAGQVRQHQESTELQYRLVDRASSLGWPRERITVIDDDLGKWQKAARGDLRLPLPAGLAYGRGGEIILTPDEEVQARLRLVFSTFQALQSAKAVMRDLQRHGLALPVRPLRGPAPHEIVWVPADSARVLHILQNPAYAGTYVYGRHHQDPLRRRHGATRAATVRVPVEQWPVC